MEHYPISRSVRPNGKPGHHFILNDVIRLWLACCVDEVVAEILTVPELRWGSIPLARSLGWGGVVCVSLPNAPCVFGGLSASRFLVNGSNKQLLNIALGHNGVSLIYDMAFVGGARRRQLAVRTQAHPFHGLCTPFRRRN